MAGVESLCSLAGSETAITLFVLWGGVICVLLTLIENFAVTQRTCVVSLSGIQTATNSFLSVMEDTSARDIDGFRSLCVCVCEVD